MAPGGMNEAPEDGSRSMALDVITEELAGELTADAADSPRQLGRFELVGVAALKWGTLLRLEE